FDHDHFSKEKLPARDMTSTPIPFYWPNGWSRTSREQPGGPLLSFSGSLRTVGGRPLTAPTYGPSHLSAVPILFSWHSNGCGRSEWRQQPPSSTLTSMPSMHRSSNCSTRPCAANPSPWAAGWCSPPRMKPSHLESVAVCRDGGPVSCVHN